MAVDWNSDLAAEACGLVKILGATRAVDAVELAAPAGSVHGVLGPNGAGKTTTIRLLTMRLRPGPGSARLGHDIVAEADAVGGRLALTGQDAWSTAVQRVSLCRFRVLAQPEQDRAGHPSQPPAESPRR
jgi:ABC-type branched-subunit amino acid transport system ATPase component